MTTDDATRLAEISDVMESEWDTLAEFEVRELWKIAQRQQRLLGECSEALECAVDHLTVDIGDMGAIEFHQKWGTGFVVSANGQLRAALRSLLSEVNCNA
jgi:hypothetical protein